MANIRDNNLIKNSYSSFILNNEIERSDNVDNKPSWNQVISVIITEFGIDLLIIINFNKLYYI